MHVLAEAKVDLYQSTRSARRIQRCVTREMKVPLVIKSVSALVPTTPGAGAKSRSFSLPAGVEVGIPVLYLRFAVTQRSLPLGPFEDHAGLVIKGPSAYLP